MALNFAHGVYQWLTTQTLGTTTAISGLGFSPKAIRFYWVGLQSTPPTQGDSSAIAERRGIGFAQSTTSRAAVGTFSADASAAADCGSVWSDTACVITVNGAGTVDGLLDINSIDADGFTVIVDDVTPADISVFWEAWGGSDISNVTIGAIAEPAATGTVNYTATGFIASPLSSTTYSDQCVMFAGVQTVNASGTGQAQDSGLHVGFATSTSTSNNITLCGNSDDGSATMDTDGYNYTGDCVSMITIAGGNPNARATLSAFGTDVFTLNWLARATTNRRSIYMAIKGGIWVAGSTTIDGATTNATTTVSDLPFYLKGLSVLSANKVQSTVATSTANDRIIVGSALSPTSRNVAAVSDVNGLNDSNIITKIMYNAIITQPGVLSAYDVSVLTANLFTIIVDNTTGVTNDWIGYLTFGDRKLATASVGHPFIF